MDWKKSNRACNLKQMNKVVMAHPNAGRLEHHRRFTLRELRKKQMKESLEFAYIHHGSAYAYVKI